MKDKKTIIIIILLIISLSLGGYLLYDKAFSNKFNTKETISPKDNENSNEAKDNTTSKDTTTSNETTSGNNTSNDTTTSRKDYEYVGLAFNGYKVYNWSDSGIPRDEDEPEQTVNNISIPKILIDTPVTKIINKKILNGYRGYINKITTNIKDEAIVSTEVSYRYAVYKDILFILISDGYLNYRGSGITSYNGYYYDIKNDAELNVNDIIKKLNIDTKKALDKANSTNEELSGSDTAKYICNVIPDEMNEILDVYYTTGNNCTEHTMLDYFVKMDINK